MNVHSLLWDALNILEIANVAEAFKCYHCFTCTQKSTDALSLQHLSNEFVSNLRLLLIKVSCVLIVFCMPYNYCCVVMSIMTDWSDSESIKVLHLHTALNCYCMCVTFASAVHYTIRCIIICHRRPDQWKMHCYTYIYIYMQTYLYGFK